MHAGADRPEFAPPPEPALLRAFALAVLAHLLLLLALMHGLKWQRESENAVAEAELWSAVPQQAAPREVPQPPPPPPQPVAKPEPKPEPVTKAEPKPEPPVNRDADIAIEREKQKRELEKKRLAEEREEQRRKLEAQKKREEELAKKKEQEKKLLAEAKKKEEEKKQLAEARRKEEEKKRQEQEAKEAREAARVAKQREENMKRMQAMAGTGSPTSSGTAMQASGPSATWGAKVQARVRPHIVFTADVSGNPKAEIEVRTSPDGTIIAKRLVRSSGSKSWDEAVLRALDKAESLPRDVDGRVPSPVVIEFRPKG
jgi:colicin import membrane protein